MATFIEAPPATRAAYQGWDKQWINGSWRTGKSRHVVKDVDPFTGETLVEIPAADTQDLDAAYRGARDAGRAWAAELPAQRASVLRGVAAIMEARREEIVSWLVRESGSTRVKARLEWESTHAIMLEAASMPYLVEGRILPGGTASPTARAGPSERRSDGAASSRGRRTTHRASGGRKPDHETPRARTRREHAFRRSERRRPRPGDRGSRLRKVPPSRADLHGHKPSDRRRTPLW